MDNYLSLGSKVRATSSSVVANHSSESKCKPHAPELDVAYMNAFDDSKGAANDSSESKYKPHASKLEVAYNDHVIDIVSDFVAKEAMMTPPATSQGLVAKRSELEQDGVVAGSSIKPSPPLAFHPPPPAAPCAKDGCKDASCACRAQLRLWKSGIIETLGTLIQDVYVLDYRVGLASKISYFGPGLISAEMSALRGASVSLKQQIDAYYASECETAKEPEVPRKKRKTAKCLRVRDSEET
jgi:hypothetical protein